MARIYRVMDQPEHGQFLGFYCPGCEEAHQIRISGERRPSWIFDGNDEAPTCSPSILVATTWKKEQRRCHSFLRAGKLEFLGDCTHALAGQTVELPELPEWLA